jgi:hypothetical protein
MVVHKQKQALEREMWWALLAEFGANLPRFQVPVTVQFEFHFPDRRGRDIQNYEHPGLYDGLVNNLVIRDDGPRWMTREPSTFVVDGTRQTVIRIRPRTPSDAQTATNVIGKEVNE